MKTYCISLVRSVDRRKNVASQFAKQAVTPEFFDAVDDAQWDESDIEAMLTPKMIEGRRRNGGTWFTKGFVGCTNSHRRLYEKIAEGEDEFACILEDDIEVSSDFSDVLQACSGIAPQYELDFIFLYYEGTARDGPLQLTDELESGLCERGLYSLNTHSLRSSAGYIISREAARRLAAVQFPKITAGADWWAELLPNAEISRTGAIYPQCCQPGGFRSTLSYGNRGVVGRILNRLDHFIPALLNSRVFRRWRVSRQSQPDVVVGSIDSGQDVDSDKKAAST